MLKIDIAASSRGQGTLTYMHFLWSPLGAGLSISTFCS